MDPVSEENRESFQRVATKAKRIKVAMSVPVPRILKKKHFRVKHQKVKLFRANEPLVSVFMWGINHTVSQLMAIIYAMLIDDDAHHPFR